MSGELGKPQVFVVMPDGSSYRNDALEAAFDASEQKFERASGQEVGSKSGLRAEPRFQHSGSKPEQRFRHCADQSSGRGSDQENGSALLSGRFPHEAHAQALRRGRVAPSYNPHAVHKEFPERWRRYIRSNFSDLVHVQQVFGVSERTARKWWKGETGANGGHVAIAMRENPVAANRILFSED